MTATEYINAIRARNPALFNAAKIQMSPEVFELQLKAAFAAGERAQADKKLPLDDNTRNMFETMFGKGFDG